MGQARPTFERRQLGLTLRRLREGAGVTQEAAAASLGKVRSRVIALEDGTATATEDDLVALMDCYGMYSSAERGTLLALGEHARLRQKRRSRADVMPDAYQRLADLEAGAEEIHCFEAGVIPVLLQSEPYRRAVVAEGEGVWWDAGAEEAEAQVVFRRRRQDRVFGATEPRTLRFVIAEDALRANLGRRDVMVSQLDLLLALISGRRDLAVRVLRGDVHGNPARGANLLVLRFGDRGASVAYSAAALGAPVHYDDPADVGAASRAFERVWGLASSRRETRSLIEGIAAAL
jgi:transcriptional regulator with XRE-family HTH domain